MPGLRGMPAVMTTMSELRGVGVVIRADDVHVALLDRHGLEQVERLALRNAFHDVDQNDVGQFLGCNPVRRGRAHVSRTYDGYFLSHDLSFAPVLSTESRATSSAPHRCYMFSMMRVANSLVFDLGGPCHLALEVVGDELLLNGLLHRRFRSAWLLRSSR